MAGNAIDPLGWRFYDFGMEKPAKWMLMGLVMVVLGLALPAGVLAEDYQFATNGNAFIITKYIGAGGVVTIPEKINGLPVAHIGDWAFQICSCFRNVESQHRLMVEEDEISRPRLEKNEFIGCSNLTSVIIPNTVKTIGIAAFVCCTNLTSVTIPNSVTSIGELAFADCQSLPSVTIPNSVTSIGEHAFDSCQSLPSVNIPNSVTNIGGGAFSSSGCLTAITVDAKNTVYSSMDGVLFNKSQTTLIQFPSGKGKGGTYTIPNSVKGIGVEAFVDCYNLKSVNIPNSVLNIGSLAFMDCTNLPSITLPNKVISIGDWAFSLCPNLTSVYFQGNAPSLGLDVFNGTTNATIYYLPTTTGWGKTFGGRPTAIWKQ